MAELGGEDQVMLKGYTELARRIWEDEGYKEKALGDPRAALAEIGWDVPEGTDVHLAIVELGEGGPEGRSVEEIVASWRHGIDAGELRIAVPSEPQPFEPETLSDEELTAASGGVNCTGGGSCFFSNGIVGQDFPAPKD